MSNANLTGDERQAALFAGLVMQQTNMALMCLGRLNDPAGKTPEVDLETAALFIDTLDMIGVKTQGNLQATEERLLKQSLQTVRMAYVESVQNGAGGAPASPVPAAAPRAVEPPAPAAEPDAGDAPAGTADSPKRFSKKY